MVIFLIHPLYVTFLVLFLQQAKALNRHAKSNEINAYRINEKSLFELKKVGGIDVEVERKEEAHQEIDYDILLGIAKARIINAVTNANIDSFQNMEAKHKLTLTWLLDEIVEVINANHE